MNGLQRLDLLALAAGLVAAVVLVGRAPESGEPVEPLPRPAPLPLPSQLDPPPPDLGIQLHLSSPPLLPARTLVSAEPLDVSVTLPAGLDHRHLMAFGGRLDDHPSGGMLRIPPGHLSWGLNILALHGTDRSGRPIDRAWPLLVGDTREAGAFIEPAVSVVLRREGFADDDDLDDDLSSIAARQVEAALSLIPPVEAGPLTLSHLRAARAQVSILPEAGGDASQPGRIAVSVSLQRAHVDVEVGPVRVADMPVNEMRIDAVLSVSADAHGRPRLELDDIDPELDLVERTEGAWNWIADKLAWFLEATGELMAEGPLNEAVTGVLDESLQRWVSAATVESVPPLGDARLDVEYRFAHITVDDAGLAAALDVRIACDDGANGPIGRLTWPGPAPDDPFPASATGEPDPHPLRVTLTADAANGVLHALWRCGALDTDVGFEDAHAELPLVVPARVTTRFELPPVFQPVGDGVLGVGIGGLRARVDYGTEGQLEDPGDVYDVVAVARLPVQLDATADGRGLRVGFDPAARDIALYTDCLAKNGDPCRDNVVFDRLAWLAMPFLPPVGAELPIPDVRLPESALVMRLSPVVFDPERGTLSVGVSYVVP